MVKKSNKKDNKTELTKGALILIMLFCVLIGILIGTLFATI